jgi:hypothetical protein
MLEAYVDPLIFVIAFAVSIFVVYLIQPDPIIVYKFPNPENSGKLTYQDDTKNCYKYQASEVKCPSDPNLILEHPLIIK